MDHLFISDALSQVSHLRLADFRGDDDAVCRLLAEFEAGGSDLDALWACLPASRDLQDVADLLTLWSWRGTDNGAKVMRSLEAWVRECSDEDKIWVALHQDAYPFVDHTTRIARLREVAASLPSLRGRCEEMIAQSEQWLRKD